MRVGMKVDYNTWIIFSSKTNIGPLMESIDGALVCSEEGYGAEKRYLPKSDHTGFEFQVMADNAVSLPDGDAANPFLAKLQLEQKQNSQLNLEKYNLQQELKQVKEKLAKFTEIVEG